MPKVDIFYYYLYSRGEKSKNGNLNLRFVWKDSLKLKINLGNGEYVWAKVVRNAKRHNDKWIDFTWRLLEAEKSGEWFAYNVRLKVRNGKSLRSYGHRHQRLSLSFSFSLCINGRKFRKV